MMLSQGGKSPAGAGAPAGGDGAREAGRFSARRKTDAIIHGGGTGGPGRGSTREIRQRRRRPLTKRTVSPVTYPPRPRTGFIRPGIRRLGDRHRLPSEVSEKPNQEDEHVAGSGHIAGNGMSRPFSIARLTWEGWKSSIAKPGKAGLLPWHTAKCHV